MLNYAILGRIAFCTKHKYFAIVLLFNILVIPHSRDVLLLFMYSPFYRHLCFFLLPTSEPARNICAAQSLTQRISACKTVNS